MTQHVIDATYDAVLRDWYKIELGDKSIVFGRIYEDKKGRFNDGDQIRTSMVMNHVGDIVRTCNTTYKLENPYEQL
jgi:hypothetical protein